MHHTPHLFRVEDETGLNREHVWLRTPGDGSDERLGHVHETAGGGVVATWVDADGNDLIGMPGFATLDAAAEALYWFAPPWQSTRSRSALEPVDTWVNGTITFRATTSQGAFHAIEQAMDALIGGAQGWKKAEADYNVTLTAKNNTWVATA